MNPQDPLADLHPLRAPQLIGWWPLAPGWWLLLLAGIIVLGGLAYLLHRRYRRNIYRRQALRQLQALHADYLTKMDVSHFLGQLNALLKSVALLAYPPPTIAAQHGAHWRAFLNGSLPPDRQLPPAFDDAAYQKTCPEIDVTQVQQAAQHWIKHHRAMP